MATSVCRNRTEQDSAGPTIILPSAHRQPQRYSIQATASLVLGLFGLVAQGATPGPGISFGAPAPIQYNLQKDVTPDSLTLVDLNKDGALDLVVGSSEYGPFIFMNDSTGSFVLSASNPFDSSTRITAVDLNNDGLPDITSVGENNVFIALNRGGPNPFNNVPAKHIVPSGNPGADAVDVGDVNGDGFADLVVVGAANSVYLTHAGPLYNGYTQVPFETLGGYPLAVKIVDVNGDGKPDLLVGYSALYAGLPKGLRLYLNNGTSTPFSGPAILLQAGLNIDAIAVTDVNGDGKPDLIVAAVTPVTAPQMTLSVSLNTGSTTQPFGTASALTPNTDAGPDCPDIKTADLNGDGLPDLVFACPGVSSSSTANALVYLNQGTANPYAGAAPVVVPGASGFAIAAGQITAAGEIAIISRGSSFGGYTQPVAIPVNLQVAPIALDDSAACVINTPCAIPVLTNDRASPGASLDAASLHVTTAPAHGTTSINTSTGVVTYTPASGFVGLDTFKYVVSDNQGHASNVTTVGINVQAIPVANDDAAGILDGHSVGIGVTSNDRAVGGDLDQSSIKVVGPPAHGTTTTGYGVVIYTPNAGFLGLDTFKYTVASTIGTVSNVATVTVSVSSLATSGVPVDLAFGFNVFASATPGQVPQGGGLDGHGYAYDATELGEILNWAGTPFYPNAADTENGARGNGALLAVTPGRYSSLRILGSAVNGAQLNQKVVLHYAGTNNGSTQTVLQSFSDWGAPQNFPGESLVSTLAHRVTPGGTLQAGAWHVYGYTLPIDPSRTLQSVELPVNRNVIALGVNLGPAAGATSLPVTFPAKGNAYAVRDGVADTDTVGLDGAGNDYAGELLGDYVVWSGIPFQIPSMTAGPFALSRIKQALPAGKYSSLNLLGSAWKGAQPNQPLVIAYTDGTTQTVTQGFSDWGAPQHYAGESIAKTMAYRYQANGTHQAGAWNLYGYRISLDKTKTVASITLPNARVTVLAMTLVP